MLRRTLLHVAIVIAFVLSGAAVATAQEQGGGGGGQRGGGGGQRGGGGGGNFDPAEFQQRQLERIREQLGATEEEWGVLSARVEKVLTAQREARFGGFGGFGGGRRGGGGGGPQGTSAVGRAMQDLRTTLENTSASAEDISSKLTALREARAKAQADLTAAQKELKELLTQRQEAQLVTMGMME